jgi:hypothetical protein
MRNPQARATPEPTRPEDRERQPGSRESTDPASKWAAVGAVAAVVAAVIALLAYAIPRPSGTLTPTPVAVPTAAVTASYASSSPSYSAAPAQQATQAPSPAPAAVISAGRPAGCDDALAAVSTYNQTAGSTANSEESAASQAYQSLMGDSPEANDAGVSTDISNVAGDFSAMSSILRGSLNQGYAAAVQQTNNDIQTLDSACAIS